MLSGLTVNKFYESFMRILVLYYVDAIILWSLPTNDSNYAAVRSSGRTK